MNSSPFPDSIRTVGIMSISGRPNPERLRIGEQRLRELGLNIIFPTVADDTHIRNFAATEDECARQFHELLDNPSIDAIMASRGGYGVARLLDRINWEKVRQRDIPIIGYSDISAFHLAAFRHGCRKNIHGPMLSSSFGADINTQQEQDDFNAMTASLAELLGKGQTDLFAHADTASPVLLLRGGHACGPLIPTNFTLLCSLIGTDYLPPLDRVILAVEDVNEPAHKIDGYLTHLRNAGLLQQLAGLVFGQFTDGDDHQFIPEILAEFAAYVNGPVIANAPFGHVRRNLSLPVGQTACLDDNTLFLVPDC